MCKFRNTTFVCNKNRALTLFLVIVLLFCNGCALRLAGEYPPSIIVKHHAVLDLNMDHTYTWREECPVPKNEDGRWWQITDNVIVLLPDDPEQEHRFAKIHKEYFRHVEFSDDLRMLIDGEIRQPDIQTSCTLNVAD